MKIIIINGPNLNLLQERNIDIYGNVSFDNYLEDLRNNFSSIDLDYFQSNIEGEIINKLQEVGFTYDFIILNAGGYTHTSISIADCIEAIKTPVIEVHISNIYAREKFRQKSLLSPLCKACIVGLGLDGYRLAVNHIINR